MGEDEGVGGGVESDPTYEPGIGWGHPRRAKFNFSSDTFAMKSFRHYRKRFLYRMVQLFICSILRYTVRTYLRQL